MLPGAALAQTPGGGGGGSDDVQVGCQGTAASCAGLSTPIGDGSDPTLGGVGGGPYCDIGRIGDVDAPGQAGPGQSDAIPICPDTDGDGQPDPPAPPTHPEIVAVVCPAPPPATLGRDPAGEGVTGLETYLWASPASSISASGSIRGYPVTCTLTPTSWTFTTGDGATYTTQQHGAPHPGHAATHIYETVGDYTLGLTVTWTRTTSAGADDFTQTHTEPYHVYEIRSDLVGVS